MAVWKLRRQHAWISIVSRHPGDFLTALKRLSILVTLLFNQMTVVLFIAGQTLKFPYITPAFTYFIISTGFAFPVNKIQANGAQLYHDDGANDPPKYFYVDLSEEVEFGSCLPIVITLLSDADSAPVDVRDDDDEDDDFNEDSPSNYTAKRPEFHVETSSKTTTNPPIDEGSKQDMMTKSSITQESIQSKSGLDSKGLKHISNKKMSIGTIADFYVPRTAQRAVERGREGDCCALRSKSDPETINSDYTFHDATALGFCVAIMLGCVFVQIVLSTKMNVSSTSAILAWPLVFAQDFMLRFVFIVGVQLALFCPWLDGRCFCPCCQKKKDPPAQENDGVPTVDVVFEAGRLGFHYRNLRVTKIASEEGQASGRINLGWKIVTVDGRNVETDADISRFIQLSQRMLDKFVIKFVKTISHKEMIPERKFLESEMKAMREENAGIFRANDPSFDLEAGITIEVTDGDAELNQMSSISKPSRRTWNNRVRTALLKRGSRQANNDTTNNYEMTNLSDNPVGTDEKGEGDEVSGMFQRLTTGDRLERLRNKSKIAESIVKRSSSIRTEVSKDASSVSKITDDDMLEDLIVNSGSQRGVRYARGNRPTNGLIRKEAENSRITGVGVNPNNGKHVDEDESSGDKEFYILSSRPVRRKDKNGESDESKDSMDRSRSNEPRPIFKQSTSLDAFSRRDRKELIANKASTKVTSSVPHLNIDAGDRGRDISVSPMKRKAIDKGESESNFVV
ncbi:hypothetical protein AAMO2058_000171600 [Amorphochlora amoebiformis]